MSRLIDPPKWSREELEAGRQRALNVFRRERIDEPIEAYRIAFEDKQSAFEDLLEQTVDLAQLKAHALAVVKDHRLFEALRYLAGPPISEDDLKVLVGATTISSTSLARDQTLATKLIDTVLPVIDRQRFPWVMEVREPGMTELKAAVIASAALLATQRVQTNRRNTGKKEQEQKVEDLLASIGYRRIAARVVQQSAEGPAPGEFCRESMLVGTKADVLVGLWDRRMMPIECKVSNSFTNSIKRLNREAAGKAEQWRNGLGRVNVAPTAVLSGAFKLKPLEDAQSRGLSLFWADDLGKMADWINATKPTT